MFTSELAIKDLPTSQRSHGKPLVEFRNVTLAYDETGNAIEDITLDIRRGEFVAFVGPSGCGKSTFMKLCTGLRLPTAGGVVVDGREVTGPLSITGMAFQNSNLLPWRSVLENIMLPLEIVEPHRSLLRKQYKQYEEKARKLLHTVGLSGYENKAPYELSGGMQQRASICRALIHQPELLILDEPFAALDAFTREELWCMLRDLWQEQQFTVVLVTHDLREAAFLADTIYVMSKRPGRIIESRHVDIPRPRSLESTYEQPLADIVLSLRSKIGAIRDREATQE